MTKRKTWYKKAVGALLRQHNPEKADAMKQALWLEILRALKSRGLARTAETLRRGATLRILSFVEADICAKDNFQGRYIVQNRKLINNALTDVLGYDFRLSVVWAEWER